MRSSKPRSALALLRIVVLLVAIALPLYLRAGLESDRALQGAEALRAAGDLASAIERYRVAVSWFAPGLSAPEVALERLYEIVQQSEAGSAVSWQGLWALTRALSSSASWATPARRREILQDVERRIGHELALRAPDAVPIYEPRPLPMPASSQLLVQLSFWGWIAAVLFALWSGVSSDGAVRWSVFPRRLGLALGWFTAWLGALALA